jgi:hypothetical protein
MKQVYIIFLVILLLVSCGPSEEEFQTVAAQTEEARPCSEKSSNYLESIEPLLEKWDDANQLAGSTSRIALSGPVATLQEIKQEAAELDSPTCAEFVSSTLSDYMDLTIESYLAFMTEEPDDFVQLTIILTDVMESEADRAIERLKSDAQELTLTAHYVVTGDTIRFDISYREGGGQFVDLDLESVPWSTSITAEKGELLTVEAGKAIPPRYTVNCAIVANGQIVDIQSDSGPQASVICSGNAE